MSCHVLICLKFNRHWSGIATIILLLNKWKFSVAVYLFDLFKDIKVKTTLCYSTAQLCHIIISYCCEVFTNKTFASNPFKTANRAHTETQIIRPNTSYQERERICLCDRSLIISFSVLPHARWQERKKFWMIASTKVINLHWQLCTPSLWCRVRRAHIEPMLCLPVLNQVSHNNVY